MQKENVRTPYTVGNLAEIKHPHTNKNNAPDEIRTMLMNATGETYGRWGHHGLTK